MIFSQADIPIFEGLLKRWGLDKIPHTESEKFCDKLIYHIRNCFQTQKLQELHSKEHKQFDMTSDALIELVGIPVEKRKGTDCSTNCSAALIFLGDCREHAIEMCAFFDFWQKYTIDAILRSAFHSIGKFNDDLNALFNNISKFDQFENEINQILSTQLRAGHVGIYSHVQMIDKYQPVGWDDEKPLKYRKYDLDSVKNNECLSEYELQHSFALCKFGKQLEDSFVIFPEWDDNKQKMQLPNDNGVLKLENIDFLISLEVYHLIEEHAMTFLFHHNDVDDSIQLQCKDAFYNECFNDENNPHLNSPYNFGKQVLNIEEIEFCGGMNVGTLKNVWDDENNISVEPTVRIRLLPFSKRNDTPSFQFNPQKVRFMGLGLDFVDIVGELCREARDRELGNKSRRDRFLNLLYNYGQNNLQNTP